MIKQVLQTNADGKGKYASMFKQGFKNLPFPQAPDIRKKAETHDKPYGADESQASCRNQESVFLLGASAGAERRA